MIISSYIKKIRRAKKQGKFPLLFNIYYLIRYRSKILFLEWICFASATVNLPWAFAYFQMGDKFRLKLFHAIDSDDYQKEKADYIYDKAYDFLEKACKLRPNYVEAAQKMAFIAYLTARHDSWIAAQCRSIEYQEELAKKAGVDQYNFRFMHAEPLFSTIGHTADLDAWIKYGILGLRPSWKSLILVEPYLKDNAINQCLLDYFTPYVDFVEDPVKLSQLRPLARDLLAHRDFSPYYRDKKVIPYSHSAIVWIQSEWEKQGRKPLVQLTDEHKLRGWEMLDKIGIPNDAWFVTIHVRESGFKGKEAYRDSDIVTYLKAVEEVTSRGGWVIRVGDASMSPLPAMENVFDYALSSAKNDWMDVFLLAAARFMIGSSSGPTTLSYVFGVPIAMTNNLPTAATYLSQQDLFLPRLMRRIDDQRFLNLEELMTKPYNMAAWDTVFTNVLGVDPIPNTSEEIADLVREMLDKLDGNISYTEEEESLQQRFKSLTAEREVMIGLPGFNVQCRLGRHFLNQHQHLLGQSAESLT